MRDRIGHLLAFGLPIGCLVIGGELLRPGLGWLLVGIVIYVEYKEWGRQQ